MPHPRSRWWVALLVGVGVLLLVLLVLLVLLLLLLLLVLLVLLVVLLVLLLLLLPPHVASWRATSAVTMSSRDHLRQEVGYRCDGVCQ
jgi:uncharacterized RDD family membrane protein YckC